MARRKARRWASSGMVAAETGRKRREWTLKCEDANAAGSRSLPVALM
jgi:hypothetical protein